MGSILVFVILLKCLLSRYKLLRTQSLTSKQAFHLQSFEDDFDFWLPIKSGFSTDIMVGPNQYDFLSNQLKNQEIKFDIVVDDIGSIIKSQGIEAHNRTLQQGKLSFDAYYSHKDVSFIKNAMFNPMESAKNCGDIWWVQCVPPPLIGIGLIKYVSAKKCGHTMCLFCRHHFNKFDFDRFQVYKNHSTN